MLIDWPTVIFQIINFLILIALLKRFLYGPILKAMDERQRRVAKRLADAARSEKEAAQRLADVAEEQRNLAKAREDMLLQASLEVEAWKKEALLRLQAEVDEKRQGWNSLLAAEQEAFLHNLKGLVSRNVFRIARKALADLADDELEARLISTFVAKIGAKNADVEALRTPSVAEIRCITGFPLAASQQQELTKALQSYAGEGSTLSFQEEQDLGLGVQLVRDDQKWEWNVNRYMLEMETDILKTMSSLSGGGYE